MKRKIIFLALLLMGLLPAGVEAQKKEILYYVDFCTFYDRELKPFTEMYLNVDVSSLTWVAKPDGSEDGGFEGSVLIRLQVSPTDDSTRIVYDKKVELLTGEVLDTTPANTHFSLMDVRRIALPPGTYKFKGTITDHHSADPALHIFERELLIEDAQTTVFCSEPEFISSITPTKTPLAYSRYGNDIVPFVTNGSFANADTLGFYMEVYNASKVISDGLMFMHAYVTEANSLEKLGKYQVTVKMKPDVINPFYHRFDISGLPTQSYYLHVEVYNRENKVITNISRKFFVSNTRVAMTPVGEEELFKDYFGLTEAEIDYYLKPMRYVSNATEITFADALKTYDEKKRYFLGFWDKRKANATDSPARPFNQFRTRVNYANEHYKSAMNPGWRTDRGRIMILHGPPQNIDYYPSDNLKFPYEIWNYNKIETQSGVMFVFYEPMQSNNDYTLLHSNLFGENNNPRWKMDLVRRGLQDGNLDTNSPDGMR